MARPAKLARANELDAVEPRLRFPDFTGRPVRAITLGDVTEDCTDRNAGTATIAPIMGVSKIDGIVPMEARLVGKDTGRYKRLEPDWFAYNPMRLNIGSIARWKGKGDVLVSPDYVVFRCLDDGTDTISPDYLDHFRSSTQWEDFVTGSGDGGVRVRISDILSAIVTLDGQEPKTGKRKRLESVFDFACGSGSLLLNVRHRMKEAGGSIGKIFGMEKNITTYNLARMNMLLHGVKDTEFEIYHGDTLTNDWDWLKETNPAKKPTFDAVVANPPFSYRWEPGEDVANDMRFKNHGVAPRSAADFAFLLHGLHYLKDDGVMAIILPHGVLFRGGAEEKIRRKLLDDGHIDTVIGLPANLFYSTGIPVCILVLKKCKKPDDVLFINASEGYVKGKRQNQLSDEHINRIVETYRDRPKKPIDRFARRVEMDEIEKNEFNLNILRYVSVTENEAEIDLAATHAELVKIEETLRAAKAKHNEFLKELGLQALP